MAKETLLLSLWIEKLNAEPDEKKRNAIVAEMGKTHGIKIGEAYKALKEAGYDPGAVAPAVLPPPGAEDGNETKKNETDATGANVARTGANGGVLPPDIDTHDDDAHELETEKRITVTLRHKTEYPKYRRAGLVLSQKTQSYEVTEAQLAALKKDKWVVIEGAAK
jgi:hypothetical protein